MSHWYDISHLTLVAQQLKTSLIYWQDLPSILNDLSKITYALSYIPFHFNFFFCLFCWLPLHYVGQVSAINNNRFKFQLRTSNIIYALQFGLSQIHNYIILWAKIFMLVKAKIPKRFAFIKQPLSWLMPQHTQLGSETILISREYALWS